MYKRQAQGPTRSAGAIVVLVDGLLAAHVTRGGRTMTTFFDTFPDGVGDPMSLVVGALTAAVRAGRMQPLAVEKLDGGPAYSLKEYGATATHKGAKIGGRASAPPKRRGRSVAEALGELEDDEGSDGNGLGTRDGARGPAEGLTFDD